MKNASAWRSLAGLAALAGLVLGGAALIPACKSRSDASGAGSGEPSASASPPGVAQSGTVTFTSLARPLGERTRDVRTSSLKLSVEFWQDGQKLGTNESTRSEEYSRTFELQGLVGTAPAKVSVHYDHYRLREAQADLPPRDDSLIEGKTYLLDATDGKLTVKSPDGKPIPAEEQAPIERLHADLGHDDPLVAALGDLPVPIGKRGPLREKLFQGLSGLGTAGDFKSGTVILSETRNEGGRTVAVLDWSGEMKTEEQNGLEMSWHLKGRALVAVSPAATLSTTVSGTIDATGHTMKDGARVDMLGAGSMNDEHVVTFP